MMSIRRLSLGAGYRYLMESIAAGDGRAEQSSSLTRYYAESGTPPGVFMGKGLAGLGDGRGISVGAEVSEEHLYRMLGECTDPLTGEPVGRRPNAPPANASRAGRIPRTDLAGDNRGAVAPASGTETALLDRARRPAVAGFDLTFSPPKSVSVAWALADQGTQAVIYDCHRRALAYVLAYAEANVLHARSGTNGVAQEDIDGVVAAAFTHYDSRAGDPQLHDHVVVWNRARTTSDGRWRTLDSRGLFKHAVALSELHQGVLSDLVTQALGAGWDGRTRRHSERPRWEVTGVAEELLAEFSTRAGQIEVRREELLAQFHATHGRAPSQPEVLRLRQRATIDTRADKVHRSLAEMTEQWRRRAAPYLDCSPVAWVQGLAGRNDLPLLRASDFAEQMLADAAGAVAATVAAQRATFSRANLLAEAHRLFHGVRFASPDDRVSVVEATTDLATSGSVLLSAPERHHVPQASRRADGSSKFRARGHEVYTSEALLEAEERLLCAGRRTDGPTVPVATIARVSEHRLPGRDYGLSVDQALAVEKVARSGRVLDVLVGPAGTGKSTTMAGLRAVWEAEHGPGSVTGLAPSAAAAEVLADELGVPCENTAKWLSEHRRSTERLAERHRLAELAGSPSLPPGAAAAVRVRIADLDRELATWQPRAGQLVVVDEASLAGTFALDELVDAVSRAGAKVLLVGDWAQLSSVEAGGAFRMLVGDRGDAAPELSDVRRFRSAWEKVASVGLRAGRADAIDAYEGRGRVVGGKREEMLDRIYQAWKADTQAGRRSLMVAPDAASVALLNQRARADRVAAGTVSEEGLVVADGMVAGVGDEVLTRQNDRRLVTGSRWVKNGDRWAVTATHDDGSMAVKRAGGGGEVVLPATYVAEHVEVAYATTTHRAQGRTVDTAHVLVSPTTTREALYVGATRGRDANHIYVDTHFDPDPATGHPGLSEAASPADVLAGVLRNEGAELSAHDTRRRSAADADSIATLMAEYETIARAAQTARWYSLLVASGLSQEMVDQVESSPSAGVLAGALKDAESRGLDVDDGLRRLVSAQPLMSTEGPAAVLHERVERWAAASGRSRRQGTRTLVAGLFPSATRVEGPDMAQALTERAAAIEARALELAQEAVGAGQAWALALGTPPSRRLEARTWWRAAATVAAYRDRWSVHGANPVGAETLVTSVEMLAQRRRAMAALGRACTLARTGTRSERPALPPTRMASAVTAAEPEALVASEMGRSVP